VQSAPDARREVISRTLGRIDADRLIDGVLMSFWERPDFVAWRPSREEMRDFVRWNLGLAVRWLLGGQPPSSSELERLRELARVRAATGTPVDTIPGNYRLGARFAWRTFLEAASDADRTILLESTDLLFDYVDRISRVYAAAYEEAMRDLPSAAQERSAQALLRRLCGGEELHDGEQQLAEAIGFDPAGGWHAFVAMTPGGLGSKRLALARRLRRSGVVAVVQGTSVVGLTNDAGACGELDSGNGAILAEADVIDKRGAGRLLEELRAVVEIARERGRRGPVSADEYLPELLLRRSPDLAGRAYERVYGKLSSELAHTLDVLAEHGFSRGGAAAALPLHRNTLRNRISRIEKAVALDLDSVEGRTLAALAWLQRDRAPAGR